MSEMVERMAKALEPKCRAFGGGDLPMQVAREFARTLLEAMREPTDLMGLGLPKDYKPGSHSATEIWRAMIDAALKPDPT
jgi:hypothetical protein